MSEEIDDLTQLEWRDTNWIDLHGGLRTPQIVLDYFSSSPFWDPQCNNATLRMQTQFNDLQQTVEGLRGMTGVEFAVVLENPPVYVIQKQQRRGPNPQDGESSFLCDSLALAQLFCGTQYQLFIRFHDFFTQVTPLATFYVMGANVYQSPTLYSVIANRLVNNLICLHLETPHLRSQYMTTSWSLTYFNLQLTSLFHVNSAFQEAHKLMQFQPAKGYTWKTTASGSVDGGVAFVSEQQKLLTLGGAAKARCEYRFGEATGYESDQINSLNMYNAETHEFQKIIDHTINAAAARVSMKRAPPTVPGTGLAAGRLDGLGISGVGTGTGSGVGGGATTQGGQGQVRDCVGVGGRHGFSKLILDAINDSLLCFS
ncbi:MED6 mediator sub complex component-domain-containing protein [Jimgerdemannia flammicorona]|uniref:Mediator of RNA polymerase II transcription subunit 6 n=1 Tax=Jimgerdemannia flammicorona TaxID=994334 RepID=A0A433Q8W9_9FUNG|nr:MED6 mediator sub complex component-domain-containing protein [Jimgerdemannia flammicorona]